MSMMLDKGERGFLCGKTGSGKTQNLLFQLEHTELWPRVIIDTKIEDEFVSLQKDGSDMQLFENFENFYEYITKTPKKKFADILLIRPNKVEMMEPESLDRYCDAIYDHIGPCFVAIDEVAQLHKNGRALPGLMNLLTRGRKRGKTVLMGNQRPANISRSVITETDKFFIYKLTDLKDWERLSDVIPGANKLPKLADHHFWHFSHKDHDAVELFSPVPEFIMDTKLKISPIKWL